jgi:hypothetical protein
MLDKMEAKIDARQEKMDTWIAEMRTWRKESTACQEVTEACLENKEPTSLEVESVVAHEEVTKEEATVETVGALKKRHRDQLLAIRRQGQPKKQTLGNDGSRKKLATAHRGMPCHAGVT